MVTLFWLIVIGIGGWFLFKKLQQPETSISATKSATTQTETVAPVSPPRQPPPDLSQTGDKINPKVRDVLARLSTNYFKSFEEVDTHIYRVTTQLTELFEHETYFRFEISSDVLRFEIKHFLGFLDEQSTREDLVDILKENDATFGTTSCYVCLKSINNSQYVSLQNNHCFLMKWESADIAEMINLQFHDLKMSAFFLFKTDPPIAPAIKVFGPDNPRTPKS